MAQEYRNKITVAADVQTRKTLASSFLATSPAKWDWVSITINSEAHSGGDSGKIVFDFYTRGSPDGLEMISAAFPDLTFECRLFDMSMPLMQYRSLKSGGTVEEREEEVVFEE